MKYLLTVITFLLTTNVQALDLSLDQINVGLVGGTEKAEAGNFPVVYKKNQYGVEFYAKSTVGKAKVNYVCTIGKGRESTKIIGVGNTLKGKYYDCQVYIGFFEWKR